MSLPFLLLEALGGLGLFILGMKTMSEGLVKLTGAQLRHGLEKITRNRLSSALMGSLLSSLLHSSGAASILVVGLVNSGLLSLYQSLGVLLGIGVGTTIAVQLIAFKFYALTFPAIFVGVALKFYGRRRRFVYTGEVLLGIGLLFLGLNVMETNFSSLAHGALFEQFGGFFSWKLNAVATGIMVTLIVQSSSAAVALVIALASSGAIPLETGVAVILGECLGTACIAAIGCIGGNISAKRTVLVYSLISLISVAAALVLFPQFLAAVKMVTPDAGAARSGRFIANAHTLFSILMLLVFLPLTGIFARLASSVLPGKDQGGFLEARPLYIDMSVVNTPSIAFLQGRNELKRMADIARSMYDEVTALFSRYDGRRIRRINQMEQVLDILQRELSGFLVALLQQPVTSAVYAEIPAMLRAVEDLEHVGDLCETLLERLRRKKEDRLRFSAGAMEEIRQMAAKARPLLASVAAVIDDKAAVKAETVEKIRLDLEKMREDCRRAHLERLGSGSCTVPAGLIYNDIIETLWKISEYAIAIIGKETSHA